MEDIKVEFEETKVDMKSEFTKCDPSLQQQEDDNNLLKEVGDEYTRVQKGTIYNENGDHIPVDLQFTRIRNSKGGVDVICKVPCFANLSDITFGKG